MNNALAVDSPLSKSSDKSEMMHGFTIVDRSDVVPSRLPTNSTPRGDAVTLSGRMLARSRQPGEAHTPRLASLDARQELLARFALYHPQAV